MLQPDVAAHGLDQPVDPWDPLGVGPGQSREPEHGALDRHRAVRPSELDHGRGRLLGELARAADHPRIEVQQVPRAGHGLTLKSRSRSARRRVNNLWTPGSVRSRSSAIAACPGVYPLPTSMVTSAASPSAPSAAAENDVAIEKKMTVPPAAGASRGPPSAPGTSTQTTVTPAVGLTTLATATGSRASPKTTSSASPLSATASASSGV